ncbi:MAG TPA: class I SAM-dependent methyltransferase [Vicinamibacterales bacterium]|nr:class I SAM-dependent methyltransferase [Vicinamibacterales bacterium]
MPRADPMAARPGVPPRGRRVAGPPAPESPLKYTTLNLDPDESHALVLALVPPGRKVLDIGCATGYLSDALAARGCRVVGVEIDPRAAAVARQRGLDVRVGPLAQVMNRSEQGTFDCLVFADVLEHVVDPRTFLQGALRFLRPHGVVVVSVPNVAHWSVRLALCRGQFDYTPTGLLDETHLRFFTADSLERLLAGCGLTVVERRYSVGSGTYWRTSRWIWWQRQKLLRRVVPRWPGLFAFQFVWKAARSSVPDGAR